VIDSQNKDKAKLSKRDFSKSGTNMKISVYRIASIKGLVQDLTELDKLIQLHRQHSDDDFMVKQNEAKKKRALPTTYPAFAAPQPQPGKVLSTYPLIQKFTERFYPGATLKNGELRNLEAAGA
jgi:hypothetical protein